MMLPLLGLMSARNSSGRPRTRTAGSWTAWWSRGRLSRAWCSRGQRTRQATQRCGKLPSLIWNESGLEESACTLGQGVSGERCWGFDGGKYLTTFAKWWKVGFRRPGLVCRFRSLLCISLTHFYLRAVRTRSVPYVFSANNRFPFPRSVQLVGGRPTHGTQALYSLPSAATRSTLSALPWASTLVSCGVRSAARLGADSRTQGPGPTVRSGTRTRDSR